MKKLLLSLILTLLSAQVAAVSLITETEAKLPERKAADGRTRSITRGPGIKMLFPDPSTPVTSPFSLKVAFEPRGGAQIELNSVMFVYLKSPTVDLLDRVKPGLSEKGIEVNNAEAPVGEHQIMVSLQDSEGRESSYVLRINVVK